MAEIVKKILKKMNKMYKFNIVIPIFIVSATKVNSVI